MALPSDLRDGQPKTCDGFEMQPSEMAPAQEVIQLTTSRANLARGGSVVDFVTHRNTNLAERSDKLSPRY